MNNSSPPDPLFDAYAKEYDAALMQGVSVSGEGKEYFAKGRVLWLSQRLQKCGDGHRKIVDFGCGTGSATPFLLEVPGVDSVLGIDISPGLIEVARRNHSSPRAQFMTLNEYQPSAQADVVFCNGVFHHIPLVERPAALSFIHRTLRFGGLFALWENNPWNPGTRLVMSRIPFDRDAITLTPPEARRLLQDNGFAVLGTDFQFVFPRMLKWLRPLEKALASLPFGAQYQILCRKLKPN
jgi:SAM-dependent methyltransferase